MEKESPRSIPVYYTKAFSINTEREMMREEIADWMSNILCVVYTL
jgi:hypothetical protein